MMRCKSCGGEFEPKNRDGSSYFHACPPVSMVRVERAGAWQDVPLSDLKPTDSINVVRDGATVKTLVAALLPDDQRQGDTFVERPNKRDENVKIVDYDKSGSAITAPKSEGAGVEPAPV